MTEQKKLLIFGGSGFFASHLLPKLIDYHTTCVVRNKNSILSLAKEVKTYPEFSKLEIDFKYDLVLDFASNVSVESFIKRPLNMFLENLKLALKHLSIIEKIGFSGHYVYISTDRALLPSDGNLLVNEISIANDPYGASKLFSEMIATYGCNIKNIKSSNLRFPNIYGLGQKSQQLLPMIIDKIRSGERRIILKSLLGNRNYLHINDAVNAIIKFLKKPIENQNICISGANVELKEICDMLCDLFQIETGERLEFLESTKVNPRRAYLEPPKVLNDEFFRSFYEWEPEIHIRDGLKQILNGEN